MTREQLPSLLLLIAAALLFAAGLAIAVTLWVGLIVGGILLFLIAAMALPAGDQGAREIAPRSHNQ